MMWYRKKRIYAVLLLALLLVLYVDRGWIGRFMYPMHYQEAITEQAAAYGADPYLVAAIIRVESNFKPDKASSKGALGLMQLMPATAEWIIKQDHGEAADIDLLHLPEVNIRYGTWYIGSLERQFVPPGSVKDDEIARIAAAYNAGPGNVDKWLREDTWNGSFSETRSVPFGETRHYIQRVHYYYYKFSQTYPEISSP